ncbi:LexA family protein [Alicycliphilus denitrificans]|uniref:LexA family protein n=1 Tax=Alicycliphilus denitrificans TaxID=179636 RepID=UPI003A81254B
MKTLQERMALAFPLPRKWGLSAEIARLCGVSGPTVTAWFNKPEKVATLERANAEKLCQKYGLKYSPRWLAEGEGPMLAAEIPVSEESNITEGPAIRGPYPLISEVQAGMWTELCDNFAPGDAEDWLPSTKNLGECGYMLRVRGKSMEVPGARVSFAEGMVLHVKAPADPQPGDFVIVRRDGTDQATFKKYVVIDGYPYLEAINPDWPKELKYLPMQPGDTWCGVVVDASLGGLSRT